MPLHYRLAMGVTIGLLAFTGSSSDVPAQSIKAGEINGRLAAAADPREKGADPGEKGNPGPLPCDSKNNPKCDTVSPSKPGDFSKGKGKGKA